MLLLIIIVLFADVHSVSAMLGMTAEQETYKRVGAVRKSGAVYPGSGLADLDVWVNGNNNEAYGGQNFGDGFLI